MNPEDYEWLARDLQGFLYNYKSSIEENKVNHTPEELFEKLNEIREMAWNEYNSMKNANK